MCHLRVKCLTQMQLWLLRLYSSSSSPAQILKLLYHSKLHPSASRFFTSFLLLHKTTSSVLTFYNLTATQPTEIWLVTDLVPKETKRLFWNLFDMNIMDHHGTSKRMKSCTWLFLTEDMTVFTFVLHNPSCCWTTLLFQCSLVYLVTEDSKNSPDTT